MPISLRRAIAGAFVAALIAAVAPVAAQTAPKARFSDTYAYTGAPALRLTLAMIEAGGGPKDFKSATLLGILAGAKTQAELDALTKKYGADNVKSFTEVFDFVVADALKIAGDKKIALPSSPAVSPKDGKALAAALYKAGLSNGRFDVEYMLDTLVSHPIHTMVMDDIDTKYSRKADANYHIVLTQAMLDLKAVYGL